MSTMLPLETVDHILSFLSSDSATLKKCQPIFPDIVERWLYASINLDKESGNGDAEESEVEVNSEQSEVETNGYTIDTLSFSLVLLDNPHVADYVRRVRIVLVGNICRPMHATNVLSALSKITSITLCWGAPRAPCSEVSWISLNKAFREAVAGRLRLPSIKDVTLPHILNFPLSLFDDCKGIESLSVQRKISHFNFVFSRLPRLRSLRITHQPSIAQSWGSESTLRSLSLDFHADFKDEFITFPRIIQSCSTTLVNLELDFRNSRGPLALVTLPALPALQHISIRTSVTFDYQLLTTSWSLDYALYLLLSLPGSSFAHGQVRLSLHAYFETTLPQGLIMESSRFLTAIIRTPGFLHPINLIIHVKRVVITFPGYKFHGSSAMPILRRDFALNRLMGEGQVIVTEVTE